jgi:hypothetical protein
VKARDVLMRVSSWIAPGLSREKIAAAYSTTKSKKVPGSGKTVGGGMNPSVDMSGKLIWE